MPKKFKKYSKVTEPKEAVKEPPVSNLHVLKRDGSNLVTFLEALEEHLRSEYGKRACFVETGALFARDQPNIDRIAAMFPALSASNLNKAYCDACTNHMRKLEADEEAQVEMFALILQCVSTEGIELVKAEAGWNAANLAKNPLTLLNLVKATHSMQMASVPAAEAQYIAWNRYCSIKQLSSMTTSQFRSAFQLCITNLTTTAYPHLPDAAEQARHFAMRLDPERHRQFMRSLLNRTREGAVFPATIQAVVDALGAYIPDQSVATARARPVAYAVRCYKCDKEGHYARECTEGSTSDKKPKAETAKAESKSEKAEKAEQPKSEGKKGKKKQPKQSTKVAYSATVAPTADDVFEMYGFGVTVKVGAYAVRSVRDMIDPRTLCLDSLANHSFGWNTDIMECIHDADFAIEGVGGEGRGTRMGELAGFAEMAITPESGVNALSLDDAERFRVTYLQRDKFIVHIAEDFEIEFPYDARFKWYACIFTDELKLKLKSAMTDMTRAWVTTVQANESKYSKREVERAKKARMLMERLHHPSVASVVKLLTSGAMLNSSVTGKDIKLAHDIYGPSVPALKGKTKDLGPVSDTRVLVPTAGRKEQTAYADVLYWRQVPFIFFIIKPLRLRMVEWLPKGTSAAQLKLAFDKVVNKVRARGFDLARISTDPARPLQALVGKVDAPLSIEGARSHVADAEVEIRTIKERIRATEHHAPFNVARRFVRWIVYSVTGALNMTFGPDGQSNPSRELFTGVKVDEARDLRAGFGDYAQVAVMPRDSEKNGPKERTVAAIALCGSGNEKGSWWFYNVKTEAPFLADRWTPLPMPDIIIELLNQTYDHDEPEKTRKARNRAQARNAEQPPEAENEPVEPAEADVAVDDVIALPSEREVPDVADRGDLGNTELDHGVPAADDVQGDVIEDTTQDTHFVEPIVEGEEVAAVISGLDIADPYESLEGLGARKVGGVRKSFRIARRQLERNVVLAHRLTVKKALKSCAAKAKPAILGELQQLLDKETFEYVSKAELNRRGLKKVIRSSMFLKEKFDTFGNFVKMKARLVAGGDCQDKTVYDKLSSPTVSQESVFMIIAIAAIQKRKIVTVDITGAYLECDLPENDEVYMELDPLLTRLLATLDPTVNGVIGDNGKLVVKLKKALYGLVQSSRLWFEKLKSVLETNGFTANDYDVCVFNKTEDGVQITVAFHVDDLLITSLSGSAIDAFLVTLRSNFNEVSETRGTAHSYLAMSLLQSDKGISADMRNFILKCVEGRNLKAVASPAKDDLFTVSESPLLDDVEKARFHSDVATLLYPAKRTRGDILVAVSWLSSRVSAPTEEDRTKLDRVFAYLVGTSDQVLLFSSGGTVEPRAYIDASYGVHSDYTSRTGVVIMLAGGAIGCWSGRQKIVTKSSTEAEIVALSDGISHVLWSMEWLGAQGHSVRPVVVYQDNQSVLSLMKSGKNPGHRTKHMNIRYFFVKNRVELGDVSLTYLPTADMVADMMTKPLNGATLRKLVAVLTGRV